MEAKPSKMNWRKRGFLYQNLPEEDPNYVLRDGLWLDRAYEEISLDLIPPYQPYSTPPGWISYKVHFTTFGAPLRDTPKPAEPFEFNLAEALTGWKIWHLNAANMLTSYGGSFTWHPLVPAKAECRYYPTAFDPAGERKEEFTSCNLVPNENHTCGLYARADEEDTEEDDNDNHNTIKGEIYGWGRYVRGDYGWRSEFAYPKAFHLEEGQEDLVSVLKKYGVPIYVNRVLRDQMYDPTEEGYDEYRQDIADGCCGTAEDSGSEED